MVERARKGVSAQCDGDDGKKKEIIEELKDSNEFFIRKAIGWVLREYSRTYPERVKDFVEEASLIGLSRREALR